MDTAEILSNPGQQRVKCQMTIQAVWALSRVIL